MEYLNYLVKAKETPLTLLPQWKQAVRTLVLLIAPIGPHIAEELWQELGESYSVHQQRWPDFDPVLAADEVFTLVIQVNGKVRDRVPNLPVDVSEDEVKRLALDSQNVKRQIEGKDIINLLYVPKRLVNIVVR